MNWRKPLFVRVVVLLLLCFATLATIFVGTSRSSMAAGFSGQYFAPYTDMTLFPTPSLTQITQSTGLKFYSLAFITNANTGTCLAAWGGSVPFAQEATFLPNLQSDIQFVRSQGGDVTVSFGGQAGTELADSCSSVSTLQAQYQSVIDRYHLTHIDFDIEGVAVTEQNSIDMRNKAIAALQQANPGLFVSYTLPVLPTGLVDTGVNILKNALQNNVNIGLVNIMAMDYGSAFSTDMGQNAIDAGNSLFSQLKTIFPTKSDSALNAMIGITPMIGLNDVNIETFSEQNAQQLLAYAQQNHIGALAMWSEGRDKACTSSTGFASPSCSGISQQAGDFTKIFNQFNPFSPPPTVTPTPTQTVTPTPTSTPTAPAWNPNSFAYHVGDQVSFQGHTYQCIQAHTSQPDWTPAAVPALWQLIS